MTVNDLHQNVIDAIAAREILRGLNFTPEELYLVFNAHGALQDGGPHVSVEIRRNDETVFKYDACPIEPEQAEFVRQWEQSAELCRTSKEFADALFERTRASRTWEQRLKFVEVLIAKGLYRGGGTGFPTPWGKS